ncbi:hypothetical protein N431DRAFT_41223 [Stipitochalara longipes BDJ]|nr:hypothetical protein N431DRAFT_41223 [Stipitochalara longipes BDJ]
MDYPWNGMDIGLKTQTQTTFHISLPFSFPSSFALTLLPSFLRPSCETERIERIPRYPRTRFRTRSKMQNERWSCCQHHKPAAIYCICTIAAMPITEDAKEP